MSSILKIYDIYNVKFRNKPNLFKFVYFKKPSKNVFFLIEIFCQIFITLSKHLNFSTHGFYYSMYGEKCICILHFETQSHRIDKSCLLYLAAKELQQQR